MTTQCVQVKLNLGHRASFRKEPTPEGFTHDWSVFVRGPDGNNIQHFVEKVVFILHETFNKPKRVKKEPPYCIEEVGYAGFHLPIEVHFKSKEEPRKVVFEYDMFLHLENSPPVNHIRHERLTFRNPTEDFRRKLLKGGGVGINPDAPDQNPITLETSTTSRETSIPMHVVEVPKVKGKPHAAATNALAAKKSKEKKESSSKSPIASKPSKGKEPKTMSQKESKPKDPNKSVKRPNNTSSMPEQVKKRKKSSSGSKPGEKVEKTNSSSEKVKIKDKPTKVKQPKVVDEPLFKPEAVVERKTKTNPEPVRKVLPPFEAELSTEEIEDVPSPGSSTSFSSFPNKQSGGALNTLMEEFMRESDNEDLDDSSEIVTTPFQSESYKPTLSDDSDNEERFAESPAQSPLPPPPPVEKPKTVQKPTQKKTSNGKKSKVNNEKKERTEVKKVKTTSSNKKADLEELTDLHQRLMSLQNREHLQKVVDLIEETGLFQVTTSTFDFDLCSLDKSTIQKLQNCVQTLVM